MLKRIRITVKSLIYLTLAILNVSCENEDLDSTFDQIILSNQDKVLINTANNVGFDLLKLSKSAKYNQNISLSPFQITSDINLILNGSSGSTFYLLNSIINPSDLSVDEINNSYKRIYEAINNLSGYNINLINGFWFNDNLGINNQFKNIGNYFYKTCIDSINFSNASEIENIDYWLRYESSNNLEFNDPGIYQQSQACLINGFACTLDFRYFFQESFTTPFYLTDNDTINSKMLKVNQPFNYFKSDYFSLLEIPYTNSSFSLVVLLPANSYSINDILNSINSENWDSWLSNLTKKNITLAIPEIDQRVSINLSPYLTNSELNILGSESDEFIGISSSQSFKIDFIIAQSIFKINDNRLFINKSGKNSVTTQNEEYIDFLVNRPFLYAIKENSSNLILSVGIIYNPLNKLAQPE
ncbi:MAG: serpin family protein [Bacteroidales bacterium]